MIHLCLSPHGESGLKFSKKERKVKQYVSLPAWGEWIEIWLATALCILGKSLPAWGEWIEMVQAYFFCERLHRLSPHGESGLKSITCKHRRDELSLSPHGESGLKSGRHLRRAP